MQRIVSISGLRGVVGDGLTPDYLVEFAAAVGTFARRRRVERGRQGKAAVVLSYDGRSTGPMIRHAVLSALLATGCRVTEAGVAATPTCGLLVSHLDADAGLQITASHNPIQWNGLKPFGPDGAVLGKQDGERLLELLEARQFDFVGWSEVGRLEQLEDSFAPHLEKVLNCVQPFLDLEKIRRRRFRVVLDCNHGAGAIGGPRLLEALGCEVTVLGNTPDGCFEHEPEPIEQNLKGLCQAVQDAEADVGFAQDPDADRLAIVDNTGRYIGEELTLALCADFVLSKRPGPFVINSSTSRTSEDVAARHGCQTWRASVGEANVVAKMREVSASLGGEGNGGVIEPAVGWVRDSFVGMAYVLAGLSESGGTLAEWVDTLPRYFIVKTKFETPKERLPALFERLETATAELFPSQEVQIRHMDGLRFEWADGWAQVRPSNTEPIVRLILETKSREQTEALTQQFARFFQETEG